MSGVNRFTRRQFVANAGALAGSVLLPDALRGIALQDPVLNSTANDGAPALSWDGQTLIFYSNRAGGLGSNDLYMSTRQKLTGPPQ